MNAMNKNKRKYLDPGDSRITQESFQSLEPFITAYVTTNQQYLWKRIKHNMISKIVSKSTDMQDGQNIQEWIEDTVYQMLKHELGSINVQHKNPKDGSSVKKASAHQTQALEKKQKELKEVIMKYKKYKKCYQEAKNNLAESEIVSKKCIRNLIVSPKIKFQKAPAKQNQEACKFWKRVSSDLLIEIKKLHFQQNYFRQIIGFLRKDQQEKSKIFQELLSKFVCSHIEHQRRQIEISFISKENQRIIQLYLCEKEANRKLLSEMNEKIRRKEQQKQKELEDLLKEYIRANSEKIKNADENKFLKDYMKQIQTDREREKRNFESLQKQNNTLKVNIEFERQQNKRLKDNVEALENNLEHQKQNNRDLSKIISEFQRKMDEKMQSQQSLNKQISELISENKLIKKQKIQEKRRRGTKNKITHHESLMIGEQNQENQRLSRQKEEKTQQWQGLMTQMDQKNEEIAYLKQTIIEYAYFIDNGYTSAFNIYSYLLLEKEQLLLEKEGSKQERQELKRQNELLSKLLIRQEESLRQMQRKYKEEALKNQEFRQKLNLALSSFSTKEQLLQKQIQWGEELNKLKEKYQQLTQENTNLKRSNEQLQEAVEYATALFASSKTKKIDLPVFQKVFQQPTMSNHESSQDESTQVNSHERDLTSQRSEDNNQPDQNLKITKYEDDDPQIEEKETCENFMVGNGSILRLLGELLSRENKEEKRIQALETLLGILKASPEFQEKVKDYMKFVRIHEKALQNSMMSSSQEECVRIKKFSENQKLQDKLFRFLTD